MAIYFGRNRTATYSLGNRLGGGGEGEVFEVKGKKNLVAKIYFESKFSSSDSTDPRRLLREKIETMLDQPVSPYVNGILTVAWPQDILTDPKGQFVGYTMPRVNSRYHIFAASRERERVQLYPKYTWKTAVLIAYNLALAIKMVHQTDAVVGDMNPNNIMLDEKGHVTLIDTDSFNITNRRTGKTYKCTVGVPEMLPPELQGKNLMRPGSIFTKQTDSFALSIHIFNLLMNNCHPFGSVGHQVSSGKNPVVSNIERGNCPYVTHGVGVVSPDAPNIRMLPKEVRQLFDRAFSYTPQTAKLPGTIAERPSADEWQRILGALFRSQMSECRKAKPTIHVYPSGYPVCPWCEIKRIPPPGAKKASQKTSQKAAKAPPTPGTAGSGTGNRKAWPLWLTCILAGILFGPFLAHYLDPICRGAFDHFLTYEILCTATALLSAGCGASLANFGQEYYQRAPHPWPWIFLFLLVPFVTTLVVAALMAAIFVLYLILSVLISVFKAIVSFFAYLGSLHNG